MDGKNFSRPQISKQLKETAMYLRCANKQDEQWTIVNIAQKDLAEKYFETVEEREGTLPGYRFSVLEDGLLYEKNS